MDNNEQLTAAPSDRVLPLSYCQNSLPRSISFNQIHFVNALNDDDGDDDDAYLMINNMPELSISSPSLFDSGSSSSSPTLSPAVTVHKLY